MQETTGKYRIERLTDEKLGDMQYLYKNAFHTGVSIEFLKKKYETGAFGLKYTGFIAYDTRGNPAAYYGIFPLHIKYKGEVILAAQSGDTMTHSSHRGKGLFLKLASMAYSFAKESGVKFVYGFPNHHNSYYGLMKLKWTHDGYINRYKIGVVTFPLAKIAQKVKFLSGIYTKYTDFILRKYKSSDKGFENPIPDENIIVLRDENYFKYKEYFKKHILKLEGRNVYVKVDGSLLIGDIEKCTEEVFFSIIKKLRKLAFKLGAVNVVFQQSPGTEYDRYLSSRYKGEEGLQNCYLDLSSGLDLSKLRFSMADLDTF